MPTPVTAPVSSDDSTSRDFERILIVHAHPDDETIVTGATLATLALEGASVTVVTCTRGELGEVMPDDLAYLRGDEVALAVHRQGEIAEAMATLGVRDHRFLGSASARTAGLPARVYRDSGMEWGENGTPVPIADLHPQALCAAEFGEVVSDLAAVVADIRPDAIVSYDVDGGYGHPDHVRVNRAALRAARLAGVPYFAITGGSAHPEAQRDAVLLDADLVIDGAPVLDRKVRALESYRSQVRVVQTPGGPALEYPHGAVDPVAVVESFRHVAERVAPAGLAAPELDELGVAGKAVTVVLALVAGGLFGAIGTVGHQVTAGSFPLGAVLALALAATLLAGFRALFGSRLVAGAASVGMLAVILLLTGQGSGGSALIPANLAGYGWTYGTPVIIAIVLAWPRLPTHHRARSEQRDRLDFYNPDAKEQPRP